MDVLHVFKEHSVNSVHSTLYTQLIAGLKQARLDADLTQVELAERLDKPQPYIAKIEGCERRLDIAEFVEYATALGHEPDALFKALLLNLKL